jgi:hypothetical protein
LKIDQNVLKELILYDENSGVAIWKFRSIDWFSRRKDWIMWNNRFSGKPIGTIKTDSIKKGGKRYIVVKFDNKKFYLHRWIFIYVNGYEPDKIDHIDGDGLNNKWINLRDVDNRENSRNRKIGRNNSSGQIGVTFHSRFMKYQVRITDSNKKRIHLGYYDDLVIAIKVRKEAEIKYAYHKNHGN